MCGIVGGLGGGGSAPLSPPALQAMLRMIRHRGPNGSGIYLNGPIALGHARLAVIDLAGGSQPMTNEDETLWLTFNGEIFNYLELREGLLTQGHRFRTTSDSEVLLHLYEELGSSFLSMLNGDFAFALWDARCYRLLLARDRVGVRPLFYTIVEGVLLFASEIKALLADPRVPRRPDLRALDQVFTFWAPQVNRTMFEDIHSLPAGHYAVLEPERLEPAPRPYWVYEPKPVREETLGPEAYSFGLRQLLTDATRLRCRADVPVGAYLSGGLDSSIIAALAGRACGATLHTFSVAFDDPTYDERWFQQRLANHLDVDHQVIECGPRDIGEVFPATVWHSETPLLRSAPAPLLILAALVRKNNMKVVLTGEGADEFLGGYDIFKEARIRRFMARDPESRLRPLLLRRLYDWLPRLQSSPTTFLEAFFRQSLSETDNPLYSHLPRWRTTARLKRFFSPALQDALTGFNGTAELMSTLPQSMRDWTSLSQAQFLEVSTFLGPYLLSSQGDRVAMAHAVEGRFPFLDYRVLEYASSIPDHWRLCGLQEKHVLKRGFGDLLPAEVSHRRKQPYRAPIKAAFFGRGAPSYVEVALAPEAVAAAGYFNPRAVERLVAKCRLDAPLGEFDGMALAGILSTQLWHTQFIDSFTATGNLTSGSALGAGTQKPLATTM